MPSASARGIVRSGCDGFLRRVGDDVPAAEGEEAGDERQQEIRAAAPRLPRRALLKVIRQPRSDGEPDDDDQRDRDRPCRS